jgi:hypothetical protein
MSSTAQDVASRKEAEAQECSALCIALGAFGAFVAVIANLATKKDVSTIAAVKEALGALFGMPIPLYGAALLFVLIGIVLVVISRISDRQRAFYSGLSATAIVMTAVPQSLQPGLVDTTHSQQPTQELQLETHASAVLDLFIPTASAQARNANAQRGQVKLSITTSDAQPLPPLTVSVREESTGALVARSRVTSAGVTFTQSPGSYLLVVDADAGYLQYVTKFAVTGNDNVELKATLQPTRVPSFVQKLTRKY